MTPVPDPPKVEVKIDIVDAPKPTVNEPVPDENPLLRKIRELKRDNARLREKAKAFDALTLRGVDVKTLESDLAKTKALLKEIEALL